MFFGRPFDLKNVSGVVMALLGVFWYTHLKLEKARLEKARVEENAKDPEEDLEAEADR